MNESPSNPNDSGRITCPLADPSINWSPFELFAAIRRLDRRHRARDRRGLTSSFMLPEIVWAVGPCDTSRPAPRPWPSLVKGVHLHADLGEGRVHVDCVRGSGYGPGYSLTAVLMFVDGKLADAAWTFGCLGGNGCRHPEIAREVGHLLERMKQPEVRR